MSPALKVVIIMNNYFHDVATAMLFSSALILWLLARRARSDGPAAAQWLARAYPLLTRVAWFSVAWIVVGGIPRTIYFNQVEWNLADPGNKYLFAALAAKHAVMGTLVIAGSVMWMRVSRQVKKGLTAEKVGDERPSGA